MKNQTLTAKLLEEKTMEKVRDIEERMTIIREQDLIDIQPHLEALIASGGFEPLVRALNDLFTMAQVQDEQEPFVITPQEEYLEHIQAQIEKNFGVGTPESINEIQKRTKKDLDTIKIVKYNDICDISNEILAEGFLEQHPELYSAIVSMLDAFRVEMECPGFWFHTKKEMIDLTRQQIKEQWSEQV